MSKLLSSALAAALVAGLVTVGGTAPAQDKKDTKTDAKTDAKTAAKTAAPAKGGTVEVNEGKDGKFRFTVRDGDGKFLAMNAVGFATKDDAVKAVDALKAALAGAKMEFGKK